MPDDVPPPPDDGQDPQGGLDLLRRELSRGLEEVSERAGPAVDHARSLWRRTRERVAALDLRVARHPVVLIAVATVGALVLLAFAVLAIAYARAEVPSGAAAEPTVVVDVHGQEIGTLRAEAHEPVAVGDLPDHVVQAVLAAEDRSFSEHRGVSVRGTIRAAWANLTSGRTAQGGSTLTQQYVGILLGATDPGYRQKLEEALVSVKLERQLSKDEILERYLNTVYWGRGAYGIGAAARTYFGVGAAELDPNQAALLAGMIAQPEELDPAEAPDRVDERRRYTLSGMAAEGWLPQEEADALTAAGPPATQPGTAVAHHTGAYYLDAVREQLAAELGSDAPVHGYQVTVEMDLAAQERAERLIAERVQGQPFTGALVAIDPRDGGVRALVGGPDYQAQPLNTAVASLRQPGSAFKPFTLAAFYEAGYSPHSRFDAPSEIDVEVPGADVQVSNYGGSDLGIQTAEQAVSTSTNTVFMQLIRETGPEAVVDVAHRAGVAGELPPVPALALGAGEVTPLELATAYATLAANGVRTEPRLIREVRSVDGEVVLSVEPQQEQAIDPRVAGLVTRGLTGVIEHGTGRDAGIDRPAAGKTGTTDDHRDAWFAGYTPELTTVVWFGRVDNQPLEGMTGGDLPAATWAAFMAETLAGVPPSAFPEVDDSGMEVLDEAPDPPPSPPEEEKKDEGDGGGEGDEGKGNGRGKD